MAIWLRNHVKPPLRGHVVWFLLLPCLMPECVGLWSTSQCSLQSPEVTGLVMAGDVLIGGLFPLHVDRATSQTSFEAKPPPISCRTFVFQNYQWLQAMMFAIEEINGKPDFLPNITLGLQIYDSCLEPTQALQGTLWMLTGKQSHILNYHCQWDGRLAGIIGDAGSSCSILMAHVLGLYRYPQISYFSTIPLLSDRSQFPSFFRTIPSDDFQFRGLAQLLKHFDWNWVGLLATDSDYAQHGVQVLKTELKKARACVAFSENVILTRPDRNAPYIAQVIRNSTANAIAIVSLDSHLIPLLNELVGQNITGKVFIASEAWSTSALLSEKKYAKILSGTIGFAIHSGEMVGFKEHLNSVHPLHFPSDIFIKEFWEAAFGCQWQDYGAMQGSWNTTNNLCTGEEKLDNLYGIYNDVTSPRITYNVYRAVYVIALALQDLQSCRHGRGPFHHETCAGVSSFQSWQLLHYIKNLHFQNKDERQTIFDASGNSLPQYDIVQWQIVEDGTMQHRLVGHYKYKALSGESLYINTSVLKWTGKTEVPISVCSSSCPLGFRKAAKQGAPTCCFQCVVCPVGEISNQTDSTECSRCPSDQWPNVRQDHCMLKSIEFLAYEETLGAILGISSILLSLIPITILGLFLYYRNTPIVRANNRSLSYLLLLSLALTFLSALAFIGYPTQEKCLIRQVAFGFTFTLCLSCILAKTLMVVIAFRATKPNSDLKKWIGPHFSYVIIVLCTFCQILLCVSWLIFSPPFSEYNTSTQPGKVIIECNEGSSLAFWCMLGYLGLLAFVSFVVAFLARKLPDSFNEAQFITFSMFAFLCVWLPFIPAYLSTRGKYTVALESFAILISSSALVSCLFLPKSYLILVKSERNTKHFLMGRGLK
ncbi:extracellular calcium-sensing receptor-like [Lissotriton helveticus]